ncbi:MAG TPA: hypothetical protein VMC62_10125 [Longilinea sp.]|nr:hypothetical protein [Longilinea sp.]
MNAMKQFAWLSILLLCACTSTVTNASSGSPTPTPTCQIVCKVNENSSTTPDAIQPASAYSPQAGDALLARQNAFVDSHEITSTGTVPPQFTLHLTGSLPTPCNALRVDVKSPDANNLIAVDVYSVASANEICAQVTKPFDVSIPIVVASGSYTITVNDQSVGKLDMP